MKNYNGSLKAFTLVELLVVISIIALLLAILMPALGKARNQARIITCQANAKQLGLVVQTYKTENQDFVPIMLNRWMDTSGRVATKTVLLSVALRKQITPIPLPGAGSVPNLNPDDPANFWATNTAKMNVYLKKYMPAFFACPFVRGKPAGNVVASGTVTVGGQSFDALNMVGSVDCWNTPLHPSLRETIDYTGNNNGAYLGSKGYQYLVHPFGMPHGSLKYAMLSWFSSRLPPYGDQFWANLRPTRWGSDEIKAMHGTGPSDAVVTYCYAGETYQYSSRGTTQSPIWAITNYKSHMRGKQGGTNGLFVDGHSEWIEGSQIGWP